MPHQSDPKTSLDSDEAVTRRILDEAKAEPIPAKIVELAAKLEGVLASKLGKAPR